MLFQFKVNICIIYPCEKLQKKFHNGSIWRRGQKIKVGEKKETFTFLLKSFLFSVWSSIMCISILTKISNTNEK